MESQENHVREQADRFGLNDRIVLHGRVPRRETLSAVKGASLAVVITTIDEQGSSEELGMVTGKIFEAIGLGTPVLLITPNGSDAAAITAPTGLVKSFTGADIQGMASFLKDVIRGETPRPNNVEVVSWPTISKSLDMVLRNAISSNAYVLTGSEGTFEGLTSSPKATAVEN